MGTPKEMLYLELGCVPFRDIVQRRGVSFLLYLLHEDPSSMVYKFLEAQLEKRNPKDWTSTVLKDLAELGMTVDFTDYKSMKKSTFMLILNKNINENALKKLNDIKAKQSKVLHLQRNYVKMKKYRTANKIKIIKEEDQLIFKLRNRVT